MLREDYLADVPRLKEQHKDDPAAKFGAVKLFHGNSVSGRTAWLSRAYADRPGYFGLPPARSQEALDGLVRRIHEAGLQACIHANGDREITMVLDAYERVLAQRPRPDHRHRIEHCSVVTEEILKRIQKLKLVIAPHSYIYEHGDKLEPFGADRWEWMLPNRALIDLGVVAAGNSDYPVSAAVPLLRIQDLVTRMSAEGKIYGATQRITPRQALRSWTLSGAYAGFAERAQGSIEAGKLADFVVLGEDPTQVRSERIKDVAVEQTFIGGRKVWDRAGDPVAEGAGGGAGARRGDGPRLPGKTDARAAGRGGRPAENRENTSECA
jgi:predicted amidohydrolase YtcJ